MGILYHEAPPPGASPRRFARGKPCRRGMCRGERGWGEGS
jgi:hypothetical protein